MVRLSIVTNIAFEWKNIHYADVWLSYRSEKASILYTRKTHIKSVLIETIIRAMTDVFTLSYAIRSPDKSGIHHYGGNFATLASAKAAKAATALELGKEPGIDVKFDISVETLTKVMARNADTDRGRVAIYTVFYYDIACEVAKEPKEPEYTCGSIFRSRREADTYANRITALSQGPEVVCVVYKSALHGGVHRISEERAIDSLKEEDQQKIQRAMRNMEKKFDILTKIAKIENVEGDRILYCMAPPQAAPLCGEFPSHKSSAAFVVERHAREVHARISMAAQLKADQAAEDARINEENIALRAAYIDEMNTCVRAMSAKKFRQRDGAPPTAEDVEFIAQFIEGAVECRKLDVAMYNSKNMFCSKPTERAAPFAHSVAAKFMTPEELEPFVAAYASCRIFLRSAVVKEKPAIDDISAGYGVSEVPASPVFSDFSASFSSFDT